MNNILKKRVEKTAQILITNQLTVREVAKIVGCSKSTVHKDLTERLPLIDIKQYEEVIKLLNYHKSIRHIRGGISTKMKYIAIKDKHQSPCLLDR